MHDFTGGIQPSGLVWTVPLPTATITVAKRGRVLTVDARDIAVLDSTRGTSLPATVSFQMTWTAKGRARRLGRRHASPTSSAAFLGRLFTRAKVSGTFSGTVGDLSFQSDPTPLKTLVGELGTERNGVFLRPSGQCTACGAIALP